MSQTMRFHLADHLSHIIARAGARRGRGVAVSTTTDSGLLDAGDEDQLAYALREHRVLLTHDPDLIALAHGGQTHAGIAYCDQQRRSLRHIIQSMLRI